MAAHHGYYFSLMGNFFVSTSQLPSMAEVLLLHLVWEKSPSSTAWRWCEERWVAQPQAMQPFLSDTPRDVTATVCLYTPVRSQSFGRLKLFAWSQWAIFSPM